MFDWDKVEFKNEKRYLSNMFLTPVEFKNDPVIEKYCVGFEPDNKIYPSTEHIYQMMKSDNPSWKELIKNTDDPHKTKTLVRKHFKKGLLFETENYFSLRSDWDDIKYNLMFVLVYLKFSQNEELKQKLISLEGYIEEKNCWNDTYWGTVDGVGQNNLGKILMEVRRILKEQNETL